MQRSLQLGRTAGWVVGLSHGTGILLYASAVALGAAELQTVFPQAFNVLQIIGLAFLAYLGLTMLRGGWRTRNTTTDGSEQKTLPRSKSKLNLAAEGFLIVFFNPKIAIFFFAIFSQFLISDLSLTTRLSMAGLAGSIDALWYCAVASLVSLPVINTHLREYAWQLDMAFGATLLLILLLLL
jgi:threonine/homoserine/homoserine lactone efflux protein